MSDKKTTSSFEQRMKENSLLYGALMHILSEIRSPENTYYAGEHFHNDPRNTTGERLMHYIETGRAHFAMMEYREAHPERSWILSNKIRIAA